MAKPIKETPVLTGKDAKRFIELSEQANEGNLSITANEKERIRQNFDLINSIVKF
jgi:hypothetical protein